MIYLITFIIILLDYLISYFSFNYFNNINMFFPMLTLTYIVFLYKKIKLKKYLKIVIIAGIIYDLLFSNMAFFNTLIFYLFSKILIKVDKVIRYNTLVSLILLIFFIFSYDLILYILIFISAYNSINIIELVYKFKNSLVLNISFYVLLMIILNNKKLLK